MQVDINSIRIKKRVRRELHDIDQLADSLKHFGQLHPITITRGKVLVSGRRRLAAASSLGWKTIEAIILDETNAAERLQLELEENLQRCPLGQDELDSALERLERLKHPGFLRRCWNAIVAFFMRLFGIEQ
ncbi:MAG: ParB N-terminal domain-containing protein [Spirochaetia bacterium]|nr:ParB N-terminal domain-containing protein [Spirochaetia bacterium]